MKYKVEIEETITYLHEVIVEAEDEEDIESAMDCFVREGDCKEAVKGFLQDNNVKVLECIEDGSGDVEFNCSYIGKVDEDDE